MPRTKRNRRTGREKFTRSNAATATLLTLVKPAETLARHKRTTRNGNVHNHIVEHGTIYTRNIKSTETWSTCCYLRLTSESWFTNVIPTPQNHNQRHRTNVLLTESSKSDSERTTGQLTIWLTINDCLTVTIDGSKRTNDITSLHSQ